MGFRHVYQVYHNQYYASAPMKAIVVFGPFCTIHMYAGYCLWRLKSRGRPLAAIGIFIGMAGFPIITIMNTYCARALLSKKTTIILSPDYQRVIAATPSHKLKPPIFFLVSVVLGILLIFSLLLLLPKEHGVILNWEDVN